MTRSVLAIVLAILVDRCNSSPIGLVWRGWQLARDNSTALETRPDPSRSANWNGFGGGY